MIVNGKIYEGGRAYFDWALQAYLVSVRERSICSKSRSKCHPYCVSVRNLIIAVDLKTPIMCEYIKQGMTAADIKREMESSLEDIILAGVTELYPEWIKVVSDTEVSVTNYPTLEVAQGAIGLSELGDLTVESYYFRKRTQ